MTWRQLLRAVALAGLVAFAPAARAHDVAGDLRVHAIARADDGMLRVAVRVPLELTLNLDLPKRGNGYLDLAQVGPELPRAVNAIANGLEFFEDGRRLVPARGQARIALPSDKSFQSFEQAVASIGGAPLPAATDVFWNQGYLDALLEYPVRSSDGPFAVDFHISPGLRDRLKLDLRHATRDGAWRAVELATGSGRLVLDPSWYQAAGAFAQSGFAHILGGFDHLLFLICLVAPFRRIDWRLVGIVTSFTIAHSITLIAAAYGVVPSGNWFPPLVEVLIAVSILYMAIENILGPDLRRRWLVTGAFGLVHGFGFSFALANELQFAGQHLLVALVSFNVGVELGQLLVLGIVLVPLAWLVGRNPAAQRLALILFSAFVAHEAWHWLTERWASLAKADWPALEASLLWQLAAAALLLVAVVLLARVLPARAPGERRSAAGE